MIERNHEYFVSLEVAKLLKEAGFDWKVNTLYFSMQDDDYPIKEELIRCIDYFPNRDQYGTKNPFHNWNQLNTEQGDCYAFVSKKNLLEFDYETIKKDTTLISAPTLEVAQRWLREVKEIYIGIVALENKRCVTNSDGWTFHYEYGKPTFDCDIQNERCETISTLDGSFGTYEEAQEAGIKKVLEIILEK